ncbi:MAG TPA: hypothetical protein VIA06_21085 [Candidatus Dormibacteraeota bacterium]|jgi:hypothetical protein|nr:hypothetical protein [Candidatus Dormibacteraeota bacterium]
MPADDEAQRPPEVAEPQRRDPLSPEPGQPLAPAPQSSDQLQPGAGRPIAPIPSSVGPPIPDSVINRLAGIGGLLLVVGAGVLFLILLGFVIWFVVTHL